MFSFLKVTEEKIDHWEEKGDSKALLKVLQTHKDNQLRGYALRALGRVGDLKTLEAMLAFRHDPTVHDAFDAALESFADFLFQVLEQMEPRPDVRFMHALPPILLSIGKQAKEAVLDHLASRHPHARLIALQSVAVCGFAEGLGKLPGLIGDKDLSVQKLALAMLKQCGPRAMTKPLFDYFFQHFYETNNKTYISAILSLGWEPADEPDRLQYFIRIQDMTRVRDAGLKAIPALITSLALDDETIAVRCEELLLALGKHSVEPLLQRYKETANGIIRLRIGRIFKEMDSRLIVPGLITMIKDEFDNIDDDVFGLITSFDKEAVPYLADYFKNTAGTVPDAILSFLKEKGWKPASKDDQLAMARQLHDWKTLLKSGNEGIKVIIAAIKEDRYLSRDHITELVLAAQAGKPLEPLMEELAMDNDLPEDYRLKLVDHLKSMRSKKLTTVLKNGLTAKEAYYRKFAAQELEELGEHQWLKIIKGDDGDFVRLVEAGSKKAVDALVNKLYAASERREKEKLGRLLVHLCGKKPDLFLEHWKSLAQHMTGHHEDTHHDIDYNRSSDCDHVDEATDTGMTVKFPENPPQGIKEVKTDF